MIPSANASRMECFFLGPLRRFAAAMKAEADIRPTRRELIGAQKGRRCRTLPTV